MSKKIILSAVALSALVAAGVSMADQSITLINTASTHVSTDNKADNTPLVAVVYGTLATGTTQSTDFKWPNKLPAGICEVINTKAKGSMWDKDIAAGNIAAPGSLTKTGNPVNPRTLTANADTSHYCGKISKIQFFAENPPTGANPIFSAADYVGTATAGGTNFASFYTTLTTGTAGTALTAPAGGDTIDLSDLATGSPAKIPNNISVVVGPSNASEATPAALTATVLPYPSSSPLMSHSKQMYKKGIQLITQGEQLINNPNKASNKHLGNKT
ncbi:MAG: hypothetical protein P1U40_05140 [Coxiellaceae bacterium]|nr:hypothetical protein [Coxiellaceae bacterium]